MSAGSGHKKRAAAGPLVFAAISVAVSAFAAESADPLAHLRSERDELIGKLASGTDYEASLRRWRELLAEHDKIVSASTQARERLLLDSAQKEDALKRRLKLREEYHKTADYDVSWRCTFSPDPAHPIPSTEGRFRPDWGKVTRRQQLRRPPKNELDEGEPVTMFEVKGVAKSYQFAAEHFSYGSHREDFEAAVGDLVLVCDGGEDQRRDVPAGWGPTVVTSGFAVRLTEPPLIVKKAKWAPVHVTGTFFFWAIHDVRWKLEPGQFVLSNIEIFRDLGGGRYEIDANQGLSWILEVPPSVKIKEPLVPGRSVWAIMGNHRFDKALKKLVLVAEDLEPRYITEKR